MSLRVAPDSVRPVTESGVAASRGRSVRFGEWDSGVAGWYGKRRGAHANIGELCSLAARRWPVGRSVKGLHGPSVKVQSKDAAVFLGGAEDRWGWICAESGESSSSESERCTRRKGKGKRMVDWSRWKQKSDKSSRGGYREPSIRTLYAKIPESSDWNSPGERST